MTISFCIGVAMGFLAATVIVGLLWIHLTQGNDHPLTEEEIKQRVGEYWG